MPVLVLFYLKNDLTYAQIFFLQAWFTLFIMIFEIPSGAIADLLGRRKIILISGCIHFVSCLIYSISHSFTIFLFCESLWGISQSFASGTLEAFVYDSLKDVKKENNAKQVFVNIQTINMLSKAVASIIGAFIASFYGYRFVFFLTTFSFIAAFILSTLFTEPECVQKVEKITWKDCTKQFEDGFKIIKHNPMVIFLTIESTIIYTCIALSFWFFQPLWQSRGLAIAYFGIVIALFNMFSAIGVILAPKFEKKIGAQKTILVSEILPCALMIITGIWVNLYCAIIGFIIIHGINMVREGLFNDYFNRFIDTKQRATVLSVVSFIKSLSYSVLGPIVGKLIDYTSLDVILLGIGIITGVLVIVSGTIIHISSNDFKSLDTDLNK